MGKLESGKNNISQVSVDADIILFHLADEKSFHSNPPFLKVEFQKKFLPSNISC